jgi:hypothetical protein
MLGTCDAEYSTLTLRHTKTNKKEEDSISLLQPIAPIEEKHEPAPIQEKCKASRTFLLPALWVHAFYLRLQLLRCRLPRPFFRRRRRRTNPPSPVSHSGFPFNPPPCSHAPPRITIQSGCSPCSPPSTLTSGCHPLTTMSTFPLLETVRACYTVCVGYLPLTIVSYSPSGGVSGFPAVPAELCCPVGQRT